MREIDPELVAEAMAEIEADLGHPDAYSVSIDEWFWRLVAKGYQPSLEDLSEMQRRRCACRHPTGVSAPLPLTAVTPFSDPSVPTEKDHP